MPWTAVGRDGSRAHASPPFRSQATLDRFVVGAQGYRVPGYRIGSFRSRESVEGLPGPPGATTMPATEPAEARKAAAQVGNQLCGGLRGTLLPR
jgi:hypothetical protein